MNGKKNLITVSLMVSSVVLLLILQVFWLGGSYKQAYYDFRREANVLFKTTVIDLRDSLLLANIKPVTEDSVSPDQSRVFAFAFDSLTQHKKGVEKMTVKHSSSEIQVYINQNDSAITHNIIGPIASKIQHAGVNGASGTKRFVIRIVDDSLQTSALHSKFQHALITAGITVPFTIEHTSQQEGTEPFPGLPPMNFRMRILQNDQATEPQLLNDSAFTESVHINPVHQYRAAFYKVNTTLIKTIAPQILFSIFLTLMISGAFMLMYRNQKAQQKLMELKNDFISNVTHELKTPVATVSVALEALKNFQAGSNPALAEEYLSMAQNELNRLTLMMDKILKASIFEKKGVSYVPEKVDVKQLIDQVLTSLKLVFEKRNATVSFSASGEDFTIAHGSTLHLTNVIYNLLDNAIKYSPISPQIQIDLKQESNQVSFFVHDNGIGIAREYQKKIFEKFFRVPTGDVHTIKGYGLGLNYVERVVESHHGKINVKSAPGTGSTFYVTLPKTFSINH